MAGHSRGKTPEIPVIIPDSRELSRESGLLWTADWGKLDLHGTPITSIPGTFYLDYYRENGQRVPRAIGDHPLKAKVALYREAMEISVGRERKN
jgi:hypothetical protein